jgi:hypothetical protein
VGLAQECVEFTLIPAGHFILQEHGEELGIGQLAIGTDRPPAPNFLVRINRAADPKKYRH